MVEKEANFNNPENIDTIISRTIILRGNLSIYCSDYPTNLENVMNFTLKLIPEKKNNIDNIVYVGLKPDCSITFPPNIKENNIIVYYFSEYIPDKAKEYVTIIDANRTELFFCNYENDKSPTLFFLLPDDCKDIITRNGNLSSFLQSKVIF